VKTQVSQTPAAAFVARRNEARELLKRVRTIINSTDPKQANWGHVGDLGRVVELLNEIVQSAPTPTTNAESELIPSACINPDHDHTTTVDREGMEVDPPIPMRCNHCYVPTHYDEGTGWYHHDDPDDDDCFLAWAADHEGTSPCMLPVDES